MDGPVMGPTDRESDMNGKQPIDIRERKDVATIRATAKTVNASNVGCSKVDMWLDLKKTALIWRINSNYTNIA